MISQIQRQIFHAYFVFQRLWLAVAVPELRGRYRE